MQSGSAKPPARKWTQADVTKTFDLHMRKHIGQTAGRIDEVQVPAMYGVLCRECSLASNHCKLLLFVCFWLSSPVNWFPIHVERIL